MICPNCGKNASPNDEFCPFCGQPTQFSARMRYYPRSTPLQPAAPAPNPQRTPLQGTLKQPGEAVQKPVRPASTPAPRAKRPVGLLIALGASILCCVVLLICVILFAGKASSLEKDLAFWKGAASTPASAPTQKPTAKPTKPTAEPTTKPTAEPKKDEPDATSLAAPSDDSAKQENDAKDTPTPSAGSTPSAEPTSSAESTSSDMLSTPDPLDGDGKAD